MQSTYSRPLGFCPQQQEGRQQYFTVNSLFKTFSRIHAPHLSLLKLDKKFYAFMSIVFFCSAPLNYCSHFSLILWLQILFFHVTDKSRLSSHNCSGITVGGCVYLLGKINSCLIYFLFFPLRILYWPL